MKKTIYYILAVITLLTAMSTIASCTKETAPPEEKTEEKTDIPEKQELQAPNEELILISAAEKAELLYFEKDGAGYVFHLAEEITVEEPAFQGDVISIENKYVYKVGDQYDKTMILFNDGVFVSFNKASDIRLSLKPKTLLYGYPGRKTQLDFTFAKGSYKLDAAVTSVPGCNATVTIDNETLSGTVTMTITERMGKNSYQTVLTITDGTESKEFIINLEAYYLYARGTDLVLFTEEGGQKELARVLDTNIPFGLMNLTFSDPSWIDVREISMNQWAFVAGADGSANRHCDITVGVEGDAVTPVTLRAIQKDRNDYASYHVNDTAFLNALTEKADADGDGLVSLEEASALTELDIRDSGIKSIAGIECLKGLKRLYASGNDIEDAGMLRELPLLYWLDLAGNEHIRTVDVSGCSWYFEYFDAEPVASLDLVCYAGQNVLTRGYYDIVDNLEEWDFQNKSGDLTDRNGNRSRQWMIRDHSRLVPDNRKSDIDAPYTVCRMLRKHTRGTGNLPVFITIRTVLQQDVDDGSVDRYLDNMYRNIFNRVDFQYERNYELFDFVAVYEVQKDRYTDVERFFRRCHDIYQELYREDGGYSDDEYKWYPYIFSYQNPEDTEFPVSHNPNDEDEWDRCAWEKYFPFHFDHASDGYFWTGYGACQIRCDNSRLLKENLTSVIWDFGDHGKWGITHSRRLGNINTLFSLDNICGIKIDGYASKKEIIHDVCTPNALWLEDARQLKIDYDGFLKTWYSLSERYRANIRTDYTDSGPYAGWWNWE